MEKVIADLMEKRNKAVKPEEAIIWEAYSMPLCDIEGLKGKIEQLKAERQQLKDIISKMCMELVDPDDDMSNGLAEYFSQELLLEISEVLK